MTIKIVKKATSSAKPVAYCEFLIDDPPPMIKKS